jgi:hypothetical protein
VVFSDFIGSPGFAGDHLGFFSHRIGSPGAAGDYLGIPSASRLLGFHHLGFPSHHKTRWVSVAPPAPPDLDLGISASPLAPPALGGSRFPLRTPALCLDLRVSRRQWVLVAPPAPPGLAGAFLPLVALGLHSWFGYRVSAIFDLLLLFRLFFDCWLR